MLQRSTIHSSRHCFATARREGSRRWSSAASIGVFLLFFYHIDFCARSYDCVFIGTEGVASYVYSVQYERTQVVCKKTNPIFFSLWAERKRMPSWNVSSYGWHRCRHHQTRPAQLPTCELWPDSIMSFIWVCVCTTDQSALRTQISLVVWCLLLSVPLLVDSAVDEPRALFA